MAITLHDLHPAAGSRRGRRRVGRGNASGMGTYSTRGSKGQRARTGGRNRLKQKGMKRMMAAMPKVGGFKSHFTRPFAVKYSQLQAAFNDGASVNLAALKAKGLVPKRERTAKIIGPAEGGKKLNLTGILATGSVKTAVTAAGGSVKN